MAGGCTRTSWCLSDSFKHYKLKNEIYNLQVDETGLTVSSGTVSLPGHNRKQVFKPSDLVGCVCMRAGPKEPRKHLAFFTVYAYPLSSSRKKRTRVALPFVVDKADSYEANLEIAIKWRAAIHSAIRGKDCSRSSINRKKKLLLLINPNSGPGKAHEIYKKQVAPVLGEAEVAHEIFITKAANHALEVVKCMDLDQYAGLVIVSGDGLLYEVYNGLLSRPDWEKAIQFPVGVIPGGSGNGLARSLAHYFDEPYLGNPVLVSTLSLAYGYTSPMDLVLVNTPSAQRLSFLSIGLGLLSDIDIESERLRGIGETRFTVWAIARLANLRRYHARISFKRSHVSVTNNNHKRPILQHSRTVEGQPQMEYREVPSPIPRSHSVIQVGSEAVEVDPSLWNGNSNQLHGVIRGDSLGSKDDLPDTEDEENRDQKKNIFNSLDKDISSYMPKLEEPVPHDWETVEDDFVIIYACYQSHIGTDIFFAPNATLDDGVIWLLMVRGQATKVSIAKFLLGMDGSHINIPHVEMIPVESFRVEPSGKSGYLTLDGEVIPWGPLQAQILPSKGRIITR